jgi:hypothetical protein
MFNSSYERWSDFSSETTKSFAEATTWLAAPVEGRCPERDQSDKERALLTDELNGLLRSFYYSGARQGWEEQEASSSDHELADCTRVYRDLVRSSIRQPQWQEVLAVVGEKEARRKRYG